MDPRLFGACCTTPTTDVPYPDDPSTDPGGSARRQVLAGDGEQAVSHGLDGR